MSDERGRGEAWPGGGATPVITRSAGIPIKARLGKLASSAQDRSFMLLDVLSLILAERLTRFLWGGLDGLLFFRPDVVWLPALSFCLFCFCDLYAYIRYVRVFLSSWLVFKALFISFILREVLDGIFFGFQEGVWFWLSFYAATFAVVMLARLIFKKIVLKGALKCKIVVLETGTVKSGFSSMLLEENDRNLAIVAEIAADDDPARIAERLEEALDSSPGVWFVVCERGYLDQPDAAAILGACAARHTPCVAWPDFVSLMEGRIPLESVSEAGNFFNSDSQYRVSSRRQRFCKRVLDLAFSIAALVLFAPFGLLIAVLLKLSSEGPVFYSQTRVTQFGRLFTVHKFRTMNVDAEKAGKAEWSKASDPRTYPFGRLLRRYHLDEFPQFWNVVKGEMSIVGPRPERPEFLKVLRDRYPEFTYRELVPAGVTGWAQIQQGYVNRIEDSKTKLEYDLYYILNYSFYMDVQVIFLTALTFLRLRGHGV